MAKPHTYADEMDALDALDRRPTPLVMPSISGASSGLARR